MSVAVTTTYHGTIINATIIMLFSIKDEKYLYYGRNMIKFYNCLYYFFISLAFIEEILQIQPYVRNAISVGVGHVTICSLKKT